MPQTIESLKAFSRRVYEAFEQGKIHGPIHLSGGNEAQVIEIFRRINKDDWVFSTYRNHYHALLHGIPEDWLMNEILAGRSMNIYSLEHRFFTSAIVGGCIPIAVGVAAALKRLDSKRMVWCFIGDMTATTGIYNESLRFAEGHGLPVCFVIEDNDLSCNTPTREVWGSGLENSVHIYRYKREFPHCGIDHWVSL